MVIRIQVKPGGNKNEIIAQPDGSYLVKTTAKPVDGQANTAVIKLLADYFDKPKSQIHIKNAPPQLLRKTEARAGRFVSYAVSPARYAVAEEP